MSPGGVAALWLAMTLVMMGPVVLPWLRAVGALARSGGGGDSSGRAAPATRVLPFAAGYAAAWVGFSLAAAALQLRLSSLGFGQPLVASAPAAAGVSIMLAGGFQLTALKDACLSHCRSPMGYLLAHWRPGARGALAMGLRHGAYCLGCCWALMALALVVGMMNPWAMALLMAVMVLETVAPGGDRLVRPVGFALMLAGLGVLLA